MPNGVATGKVAQWLYNDVVAYCDDMWSKYCILVEQHNEMLVQLMLLHIPISCVVDLEFYEEEAEEEVS